jgi:hypothetical protein
VVVIVNVLVLKYSVSIAFSERQTEKQTHVVAIVVSLTSGKLEVVAAITVEGTVTVTLVVRGLPR